jgi:hypothetical protein
MFKKFVSLCTVHICFVSFVYHETSIKYDKFKFVNTLKY